MNNIYGFNKLENKNILLKKVNIVFNNKQLESEEEIKKPQKKKRDPVVLWRSHFKLNPVFLITNINDSFIFAFSIFLYF
jgi:hypothetical protein